MVTADEIYAAIRARAEAGGTGRPTDAELDTLELISRANWDKEREKKRREFRKYPLDHMYHYADGVGFRIS